MTNHIVKGHYRQDGGYLERGTLLLEKNGAVFRDTNLGGILTASRYKVTSDIAGIEITSSLGAWEFVPDDGECDRIGMPVLPLPTA
jgi:hypothetical protein